MRRVYYHQPNRQMQVKKESKRNIIRVIGEGKITVKPDQAKVTLGVMTEDMELQKAQQNNAIIIDKIQKSLVALSIPEEQIQTIRYSVQPQYDFIEGKQHFRGYQVEHLLLIMIDQMDGVGKVVDTAVNNGANIISGISFTISDSNYYERQALSAAVLDAYQKAETIANTLKVHLIGPRLISENPTQQGGPIPYQSTALMKSDTTTPIQAGTIQISSQVTADFEYMN
ncbi:SIMPL domain-containing protein [Bacillus sp. Bva_UNVM-123]